MSATRTPWEGPAPTEAAIEARLAAEGLSPSAWANAPGDTYRRHRHRYHKVLYCLQGSIVFTTDDGEFELRPGDRLDVPAGCAHAAVVGPDGVTCLEAAQPPR